MSKNSSDQIKYSHAYKADFEYKHKNPYHHKLAEFSDFVLLDTDPEKLKGAWSDEVFKNKNPLCVEIGTGFGSFMLEYVKLNPKHNFIGLDYRFKRSYQLAKKLASTPQRNFRYLRAKGERLEFLFATEELDRIFYFFPDPWPKSRHHKKRLFQEPFLEASYKALKPGGELWIKTDHVGYFEWMRREVIKFKKFDMKFLSYDIHQDFPDHLMAKITTKFEKIFIKQKIPSKAIVLKK